MLAVGIGFSMAILSSISGASAAMAGRADRQLSMPSAPGSQLWVSHYDGPANSIDFATAAAISPGGGTVFVTGVSDAANGVGDYATVAYEPATGKQLWVSRYNGPGNSLDLPFSIAVSPDGTKVFVTGESVGTASNYDYATIAYNAATGSQLWIRRYNGPNNAVSVAKSLAVSPDGSTVYVTGYSGTTGRPTPHNDYVTIAYNAATGAQRWLSRYNGPANQNDQARWIAVSPDGHSVYVTGRSYGTTSFYDYATVAYNAATGSQRWVSRYNGPANMNDFANEVVVASDGSTVYVTGGSAGKAPQIDFATVAYNAATGAMRWVSRYNGPGHRQDSGRSLAVTPDGRTLIVTGSSWGVSSATDYATIAYNAATGAPLWTKRYSGTSSYANDDPAAVAVSPNGSTAFITGQSWGGATGADFATIAYNIATGAQLWVSRYNGPGNSSDGGSALVVSPGGGAIYVTGQSDQTTSTSSADFATIAYKT
jgi:hypothetical protein